MIKANSAYRSSVAHIGDLVEISIAGTLAMESGYHVLNYMGAYLVVDPQDIRAQFEKHEWGTLAQVTLQAIVAAFDGRVSYTVLIGKHAIHVHEQNITAVLAQVKERQVAS